MQRIFDVLLAVAGIVLLGPLFLLLALAVKSTSAGPAFHRANRVGQGGRHFQLLKFRTMVADAALKGPGITHAGDPRITPLGLYLRRYKLDELPQLINVLRGDMSFVGPRPEDPRYVAYYSSDQHRVLRARPGITSPASIRYRNEETILVGQNWEEYYRTVILPSKLAIELEYLDRRTLLTDLGVIFQTLFFLRF